MFARAITLDVFELAFLVDAVLALDALLVAVPPVAAYTHNGFTRRQH